MRITRIILCLLTLAFCARMIPLDYSMSMASVPMLTESLADVGESEDNEWEKSTNTRHSVMHGVARAISISSARAVHVAVDDGCKIGDRGADDIPTPPPDPRC
jgi:hypothetical protein